MPDQNPGLQEDELLEYMYDSPFGGIQSEVPIDKIGRTGFLEVQNILFRKSQAQLVGAYSPLVTPSSENIMGIGDFFNVNGTRQYIVWTPTKMFTWNGSAWVQITGTLTGNNTTQFMSWDVVGYKIYFSQQKDVVQVWDGITAGFASASGSAVPGKYLVEVAFHLLVGNTIEAGANAPNRIHWTGTGDGTDWTSFSSGQTDLFNGLGPINGMGRLYQYGYAFQQWGITQIIPTGIGTQPFNFVPLGSRAKGSILPYGVAFFGDLVACYAGKDDIYLFDGTQSQGIGGRPIDGNRRLGARQRIFRDLNVVNKATCTSIILSSANGEDYESYWLYMPSLQKAWVYHFDEQVWTQVYFNAAQLLGPVGIFSTNGVPRILDLIGRILDQSWSPSQLTNVSPLDTIAISDANAQSVSLLNLDQPASFPTQNSIKSGDGWYIKSGQLTFDDPRHTHTVKKVRVRFIDYAKVTVNMRWTNEKGQQASQSITYGTGSGKTITQIFEFSLEGNDLTWEMSGPPNINWGMTEIAPAYDTGGEVQNNR